jgi:hypothetical protein
MKLYLRSYSTLSRYSASLIQTLLSPARVILVGKNDSLHDLSSSLLFSSSIKASTNNET